MTGEAPRPPCAARVYPALELAQAPRRPTRLDVVVTAALLVWAVAGAVLYASDVPLGVRLAFVAAWTLPLLACAVRLQRSCSCSWGRWACGGAVARHERGDGAVPQPARHVFCVGLRVRDQVRSAGLAAVPVLAMWIVISTGYYANEPSPTGLVILVFFLGGAWRRGAAGPRPRAAVRAGGGEAARSAVADERSRIARELHDVVVDDQTLMRSGLVGMLSVHDDLEVVGEAADGLEAVQRAAVLRPDVVVMDIRMPQLDGILTRVLAELGVRDRVQAVVLAYESGLVTPGRR